MFGHGETVTVIRALPGSVDQYGDPVAGSETVVAQSGCAVYPGSSMADNEPTVLGRAPLRSDFVVLGPAGWDVKAADEVMIRGRRCSVVGEPFEWRHPLVKWAPGVQVFANIQEG